MTTLSFRVLLVEDSPVNQEVGRAMLEALGYVVEVASNGHEVIELLESERYDVVLMDCQMPVMDGFEATRKIREREEQGKPRSTIVALTAHISEEDRDRCLAAGMDDYLSKPFRMHEISSTLEKWTIGKQSADSVGSAEEDSEKPGEDCLDRTSLEKIKSLGPNGSRMLSAVIKIFLNDSPILFDSLKESLAARDAARVAEAAHALKSTSGNLGAVSLSGICRQIENIARQNSVLGVDSLIPLIGSEYDKVKEALTKELQRGSDG